MIFLILFFFVFSTFKLMLKQVIWMTIFVSYFVGRSTFSELRSHFAETLKFTVLVVAKSARVIGHTSRYGFTTIVHVSSVKSSTSTLSLQIPSDRLSRSRFTPRGALYVEVALGFLVGLTLDVPFRDWLQTSAVLTKALDYGPLICDLALPLSPVREHGSLELLQQIFQRMTVHVVALLYRECRHRVAALGSRVRTSTRFSSRNRTKSK